MHNSSIAVQPMRIKLNLFSKYSFKTDFFSLSLLDVHSLWGFIFYFVCEISPKKKLYFLSIIFVVGCGAARSASRQLIVFKWLNGIYASYLEFSFSLFYYHLICCASRLLVFFFLSLRLGSLLHFGTRLFRPKREFYGGSRANALSEQQQQ